MTNADSTKPTAAERAISLIRKYSQNRDAMVAIGCDPTGYHQSKVEQAIAELTALIEKADAHDYWRAEALAAEKAYGAPSTVYEERDAEYRNVNAARIARGLT